MKKILFSFLFIFAMSMFCYAGDYYVAQQAVGVGNGSSCANAGAIANLTWGTGNMVAAGDTLHLCGTIDSTLTIGASGSSGSVITVVFETGAKLSKAAWGTTTSAAIYSSGKNYITIDGNDVGIIENTDNGSPATTTPAGTFGTQQESHGIYISNSDNWTIKNLTIQKIYQRVADSNDSNKLGRGITIIGCDTVLVDNVTVSDAYYTIIAGSAYADNTGLTISNSSLSRTSTAIVLYDGVAYDYENIVIDNVYIYDLYIWDGCWQVSAPCDTWNHCDGIHTWYADGSDSANTMGLTIKNSRIGGDTSGNMGQHTTAWIYISDNITDAKIYNNILTMTDGDAGPNGIIDLHTDTVGTAAIYNNVIVGKGTTGGSGTGIYVSSYGSWTIDIQNNIFDTLYGAVYANADDVFSGDYNVYYNCNFLSNVAGGEELSHLQTYLGGGCPAASGNECNSIILDPDLSALYYPQSTSPTLVKTGGADLSAVFTTDKAGSTRTTWNAGAYGYDLSGDETDPVVSAFTIPETGSSLTHAISSFTCTDAVGVTGFCVNESAVAPTAGSCSGSGWGDTAQTSYTFASSGEKTLYGWCKDAAGNISTSANDTTTITLVSSTTSGCIISAGGTGSATKGTGTGSMTFQQ